VLLWACRADYHKHPPKSIIGLIPFFFSACGMNNSVTKASIRVIGISQEIGVNRGLSAVAAG
jgi:hypothetical protein